MCRGPLLGPAMLRDDNLLVPRYMGIIYRETAAMSYHGGATSQVVGNFHLET